MNLDIFHIAHEYFSGRISFKDKQLLEEWLKLSEENREIFQELEEVWKLTGNLQGNIKPDLDNEWNCFVSNRNKLNTGIVNRFLFTNRNLLRIAAVLIPVLLIASLSVLLFNKTGQKVFTANGPGQNHMLLPDGSEVYLNKESKLQYPRRFKAKERVVTLEGEAFFSIVRNKRPFIVKNDKTCIQVLGTRFNVKNNNRNSYCEVIVEEGRVLLSLTENPVKQVIINPGEKARYSYTDTTISKTNVQSLNSVAWVTEKLVFKDNPLSVVCEDIENYFDIHIKLSPGMSDCRFSGDFTNPQINNVLDIITLSVGGNYQFNRDTVYFFGDACTGN
ncbi:MAG: FecR domain-containing protein [Bacteroidales bacterium]